MQDLPHYAELHCQSNFSFLHGASHPDELIATAKALGYSALAITDECSLAGCARAHHAAKQHGLALILGSYFIIGKLEIVLLVPDQKAYHELCQLISRGRQAANKGSYYLTLDDLGQHSQHCLCLWYPKEKNAASQARWLQQQFGQRLWIALRQLQRSNDLLAAQQAQRLSQQLKLPIVACGHVLMHNRQRRALHDSLTAIRLGTTVSASGFALNQNAEQRLRSRNQLTELYPIDYLNQSTLIAQRCQFNLDQLQYQYPHEVVPAGRSADEYLREVTLAGAMQRWPQGPSKEIRQRIKYELDLIAELKFPHYFLTIYDIVQFARKQNILCQGRGSAANSVVCYCLGITAADPDQTGLLFERFISRERNEPPDIDVDFEHQRREEVVQYIYRKYGRHRAALAATVIRYRKKSAIRDIGKALGIDAAQLDCINQSLAWWDQPETLFEKLKTKGFDLKAKTFQHLLVLVLQLLDFPRHLSQHVGGFVISEQPLNQLVPIENASMPERTVIQWDKDDLESLGLMKVDCLALGMLTALHQCFDLITSYHRQAVDLYSIPADDEATYQMIQQADTVGVFQIESRAQMAMLPRLKPENYYDLVIEIAIVRPGPIQGDMVHPYLRRRNREEAEEYPKDELRPVLEKTLGIPIFQEQAMKIAMVAAGFSADEADQLRRAMAAWKRKGGLEPFKDKLISGMLHNGYELDYAERIYKQIQGFGEYGFPESHSASFAILAYASAWLKCHYPAAFTCALLNSQPMGFYRPAHLIRDAQSHKVAVLPIDLRYSQVDAELEQYRSQTAIRLGFNMLKGLSADSAQRIVQCRRQRPFNSLQDLLDRVPLKRNEREALATAGALRQYTGHRRRAYWAVLGQQANTRLLEGQPIKETQAKLKPANLKENLWQDYATTGVCLNTHPLRILRPQLPAHYCTAAYIRSLKQPKRVHTAGLVMNRQRPLTAKGVIFLTLEDETGFINVVVWPDLVERQKDLLVTAKLLGVYGKIETDSNVHHLIARRLIDYTAWVSDLNTRSRDFH